MSVTDGDGRIKSETLTTFSTLLNHVISKKNVKRVLEF